jgi:hypothetical protein
VRHGRDARGQSEPRLNEDGSLNWSVVFARALRGASPDDVEFRPAEPLQLACATWNAAAGDGGARKSISIW